MKPDTLLAASMVLILQAHSSHTGFIFGSRCHGKNHNFVVGNNTSQYKLLFMDRVNFKSTQVSGGNPIVKNYPGEGKLPTGIIKLIEVQDLINNGCGGTVTILGGGVDYSHVILNYAPIRGYGINFVVNIYGT
ncbi:unnamed protein product [Nezara viridula]|uniref:Uncharacterized protein n=1 Tax=Nezara viridula TaxID=85310 RepID=A0A9P0HL22_NEZVI|nr:unnamed protein product [Nezara viridula]